MISSGQRNLIPSSKPGHICFLGGLHFVAVVKFVTSLSKQSFRRGHLLQLPPFTNQIIDRRPSFSPFSSYYNLNLVDFTLAENGVGKDTIRGFWGFRNVTFLVWGTD